MKTSKNLTLDLLLATTLISDPRLFAAEPQKPRGSTITGVDASPAKATLEPDHATAGFVALFPKDGVPEGWLVRNWDDVKNKPEAGVHWRVENGVLHGSEPRGTWLLSEREYGDFILEFEWRIGERGNSGTALRAPLFG